MRDHDFTSNEIAALGSPLELMDTEWAPCRFNCPVHADVRTYIELAARGYFRESADVVREQLPFAAVCGRICHHPCESNCRRQDVDESVAIREVKRFVIEKTGMDVRVDKPAVADKPYVAIIGAGPAGLSAALELARWGYKPVVFEKFDVPGGIPRTAIPSYRMPDEIVAIDTDWILAHGIQLITGCDVGREKPIEELRGQFDAILVATGMSKSRLLPIPGVDSAQVYGVLDFLTKVRFDEEIAIGKKVVVIGGGNVAMDAARTALRLGADVEVMMLENEEEMPAWSWEYEEAHEEGAKFNFRRGPVEVLTEGDAIVGVKTRGVTAVFDGEGKFSPAYDDADISTIDCDTVIMAIGQMTDMNVVAGSRVAVTERGQFEYAEATCQIADGVFACGEIVTKPGSVVEACASGQRAAKAIDMFLRGDEIVLDDTTPEAIDTICDCTAEKVLDVERNPVAMEDPTARVGNFEPIDHNFADTIAAAEARRCMTCGGGAEVMIDKCAACLTCLRVCPFDIPKVTDVARIESSLCQACGMCIAACPANAIVPRSWSPEQEAKFITEKVAAESGERKVVAFVSGYQAAPEAWRGELDRLGGVIEIYVPSVSRLSAEMMLTALRAGATGVVVVATSEDTADRYPTASTRAQKEVGLVREMLKEIGIDPAKVQWVAEADHGRDAVVAGLTAAVDAIEGKTEETCETSD
jgi:NADPH-dependent glutamate synthase beta subunit-like oxidoreductase/coenzyme F420-reducing hydrogenase delta subunit/Fe-S-cluster-containing hydrogenase component 2